MFCKHCFVIIFLINLNVLPRDAHLTIKHVNTKKYNVKPMFVNQKVL